MPERSDYQTSYDAVAEEYVRRDLEAAGFEIEEIVEREPDPEVEHTSRCAYIFARRPVEALT